MLGRQYHTFVSNLGIPRERWAGIIQKVKENGVKVIIDVFDIESIKLMSRLEVDSFNIHAADIQNTPLRRTVAETGTPIILYIGGATKINISESIEQVEKIATAGYSFNS